MSKMVVGSGVCPLAVHFRMKSGDIEEVVGRVKSLKSEIRKGGRLFKNYPESLFAEIRSWGDVEPGYFYEEGARSSIVLALKVVKNFCEDDADCAIAYTAGERNGGATAAVEKSLSGKGIRPLFDYLPDGKGDSQIDVVFEDLWGHETARVYQASRTSFKYRFNLEKTEASLGSKIDVLLLNRAAAGAKNAASQLSERGSLVSYRVHNFSRHVGVSENVEMLESANYIFITDPAKDPTIARDLKRYFDVETLDELARRILEINGLRRMVVVPPSDECENLRFYCAGFNRCVEVKCPDSPRARTAWLNGACVGLALKNWSDKAPFALDGYFPKTYSDFEKFADWSVQLAYAESPDANFAINGSWIIK